MREEYYGGVNVVTVGGKLNARGNARGNGKRDGHADGNYGVANGHPWWFPRRRTTRRLSLRSRQGWTQGSEYDKRKMKRSCKQILETIGMPTRRYLYKITMLNSVGGGENAMQPKAGGLPVRDRERQTAR
jgi:hypothetical protein